MSSVFSRMPDIAWDPAQSANALQLITETSNNIPVVDLYVGNQKIDLLTGLMPPTVYLYGNGTSIDTIASTSASFAFSYFQVARSGTDVVSCPLVFGDSIITAGLIAGTSYNVSMAVNELLNGISTGSRGCASFELTTANVYSGLTAVMGMKASTTGNTYKYQVVWTVSKAGKAYLSTPIPPLLNGTFTSAGFYITPLNFQQIVGLGSSSFVLSSS